MKTLAASARLIACFCLTACLSGPCLAGKVPKTLFVLVDGIPADVVERVETPAIDDIARQGGFTHAYVGGEAGGESESPTISAVSYQSLLTGTWANKHNVYDNAVEAPNYHYWDIFRIAKHHNPNLSTALFSTWEDNRTRLVGDGLEAAGGTKLDHYADGFELDETRFPHDPASDYIRAIDLHVSDLAASYIETHGPDLTWVYLQYTDDVGHHHGDGPQQDEAVKFADQQVAKLWRAVQQRQRSHDENWLVVIVTDHGRDAGDGRHHGGQSKRERTIWIAVNTPDLNERFARGPAIVDILPSIAEFMGLEIPPLVAADLDGQSLIAKPNGN